MSVDAKWFPVKGSKISADTIVEAINILCGVQAYKHVSHDGFTYTKLKGKTASVEMSKSCLGLISLTVPVENSPLEQTIGCQYIHLYLNICPDSEVHVQGYAGIFTIALLSRLTDFFGGRLVPSDVDDKVRRRKKATIFSGDCDDNPRYQQLQQALLTLEPVQQIDYEAAQMLSPYTRTA